MVLFGLARYGVVWSCMVLADGLNLVGLAIGNGVLDALHQEKSYAEYAYTHGLIPLGAKQQFDYQYERCIAQVLYFMLISYPMYWLPLDTYI